MLNNEMQRKVGNHISPRNKKYVMEINIDQITTIIMMPNILIS